MLLENMIKDMINGLTIILKKVNGQLINFKLYSDKKNVYDIILNDGIFYLLDYLIFI